MSETLSETADQTIRVPAGVMGLLRQSYDTREKALDWLLAFGAVAACIYAFRNELLACLGPSGQAPNQVPNQDLNSVFPTGKRVGPGAIYTYNMPIARNIRMGIGPSATAPPSDPAAPPSYPD